MPTLHRMFRTFCDNKKMCKKRWNTNRKERKKISELINFSFDEDDTGRKTESNDTVRRRRRGNRKEGRSRRGVKKLINYLDNSNSISYF